MIPIDKDIVGTLNGHHIKAESDDNSSIAASIPDGHSDYVQEHSTDSSSTRTKEWASQNTTM